MGFGAQLKEIRQQQQLTQRTLAQQLNIPQSAIAKIERDTVDMRVSSLQNLARMLGYEVLLVPKPFLNSIKALLSGDDLSQPRWQITDDDNDA
ncbi:MAG: hypothetical protein A3F12_03595 [Gammaproteobacteria bacterium RIFCSPHIGHO2_12_FULL_38_14]|nr:MAG: hypothetical protein A3F12_03595 [Gammaproteobacteria bacterium RIFCSPHIGHO2_12_FULL_38_14]